MCADMCINMCICMCIDMYKDMCLDMCIDTCPAVYIDRHVDRHVCRHVHRHAHRHVYRAATSPLQQPSSRSPQTFLLSALYLSCHPTFYFFCYIQIMFGSYLDGGQPADRPSGLEVMFRLLSAAIFRLRPHQCLGFMFQQRLLDSGLAQLPLAMPLCCGG